MDRQSMFQAPVSQPRLMLRMQPGANADADTRVGVAVGMDVAVAVGVGSSAVTGVLVAVGVWVGVVAAEPLSSAANLLVSAVISACIDSISCRSVPNCSFCASMSSCCASTLSSSRLILPSAPSGVDTSVAVAVGAGSFLTDVLVGVSVGSSVAETLVDVGVGASVIGVLVGVSVAVIGVYVGVGVFVGAVVAVGV